MHSLTQLPNFVHIPYLNYTYSLVDKWKAGRSFFFLFLPVSRNVELSSSLSSACLCVCACGLFLPFVFYLILANVGGAVVVFVVVKYYKAHKNLCQKAHAFHLANVYIHKRAQNVLDV